MDNKNRFLLFTVILVAAITLLPFLGNTEFGTKGEPREAVVAVSMLNQSNWILPENNGIDIPYKPPFFQWCIAALSLPAGHVTEFTSRLPSALALIIMLAIGFVFYAKRKDPKMSFLAAMLTLTAFEVHRAGTNCRVDMVLTVFIVGALYAFYHWWEKGKGLPWLAILCMSGATLTKGPVGIVLPCFVMFVFMLVVGWRKDESKGKLVWKTVYKLFISAVLACIIPAMWYVAAYQQGGKRFLDLVMDENVGRFLGKMVITTHENPWPYNILMLISGWLPWTLPLLLSLFVLPWKQFSKSAFVQSVKEAKPLQVFTWLSFVLILFFYCIPKSKRGVYLLPCYPFMAMLIVEYAVWLIRRSAFPVKFYIGFLTVAGFALTATLVVLRMGAVPDTIFHGHHAYQNIQMLHALAYGDMGIDGVILAILPFLAACWGLIVLLRRRVGYISQRPVLSSAIMTLLIFMAFNGYYKPTVMNVKSYRPFAETVRKTTGNEPLYAYTGKYNLYANSLRFFGIDFYLGDRVRQFENDKPRKGMVIVNNGNRETLLSNFGTSYSFREALRSKHKETEFNDTIYIYRFEKK